MSTVKKTTIFPPQLATEMFDLVRGHSSIAKMAASKPIPFNGTDVFTFNFASDISVVGESAAKPAGDAEITPVQIRPIKVVYQSRVSDEFMYASEEAKLQYLRDFADGFSKKLAAGLDKMVVQGINPATGSASSVINGNDFDDLITNTVEYVSGTDEPDMIIDKAIALIDNPNGIILSKEMRGDIGAMRTETGARAYPEFAWGATPTELGGMALDTNDTLGDNYAIVGDWNALKWGFAKNLPLEVIEYGDPDGAGHDLKQYNEVLLRSEAFVGWGILNADDFAKVVAPSE